MNSKISKFSFSRWNHDRLETLSFFGSNRYIDWMIVLGLFFVLMLCISICGFFVYKDSKNLIEAKNSQNAIDLSADIKRVGEKIERLKSAMSVDVVR